LSKSLQKGHDGTEPFLRGISFAIATQCSSLLLPRVEKSPQLSLTLDRSLNAIVSSDTPYASERAKNAVRILIAEGLQLPASQIFFEVPEDPSRGIVPCFASASVGILCDLAKKATDRLQSLRFREALPQTVRVKSILKEDNVLHVQYKALTHRSQGSAILEVTYDARRGLLTHIHFSIAIHAGKILCYDEIKAAIRASCLHALRACLIQSSFLFRNENDIYEYILSQSDISITIIQDEKASIARPVGDLPSMLVLSCFLGVLQQIGDETRFHLPLRPRGPAHWQEGEK